MLRWYRSAAASVVAAFFISGAASAVPITYSSQASFLAAVGTSITDDYSNAGYTRSFGPNPPNFMTDAYMSSVLGQTRYVDTMFPNHNEVIGPLNLTGNPYFCSGCNGSVDLFFNNTSLSVGGGVFGVSFNYRNGGLPGAANTGFDFFVTFADGTTWDYVPALSGASGPGGFAPDFFGMTSSIPIADIYFGDHHNASMSTIFGLDNLTIANSKVQVPEPLTLGVFGVGLAGIAALRRRRAARA